MSEPITTILLPGMDGTGELLRDFAESLPVELHPRITAFPGNERLGYDELESRIVAGLADSGPFVLVGESFSGPLALRVAARGLAGLRGVILVATFARNPVWWYPSWGAPLVRGGLFRIRPADWQLRRLLAGSDSPAKLLADLRKALGQVSPDVFAFRVRAALTVDATEALRRCPVPILYVGGKSDRLVPPARALPMMRQVRPDLEAALVDAPHLVLQRRPGETAPLVAAFVRRCARGRIRF